MGFGKSGQSLSKGRVAPGIGLSKGLVRDCLDEREAILHTVGQLVHEEGAFLLDPFSLEAPGFESVQEAVQCRANGVQFVVGAILVRALVLPSRQFRMTAAIWKIGIKLDIATTGARAATATVSSFRLTRTPLAWKMDSTRS
jgi:hypothetical protein